MRIIAGKAKGRKLTHDKSEDLRPTSAKVRESLFNIIRDRIHGARFLDLFAGTGAVGIEALSRGAASVMLVESDRKRAERIQKAGEEFGFRDSVEVVCADAMKYAARMKQERPFDIVFADPPYKFDRFDELLEIIYNKAIIEEGGIVILEHSTKRTLRGRERGLEFVKEYRYGDTMLTVFRRMKREDSDLPGNV